MFRYADANLQSDMFAMHAFKSRVYISWNKQEVNLSLGGMGLRTSADVLLSPEVFLQVTSPELKKG
jgi:hypothetical protein